MRLTLRTLLAYLDNTLEPTDAEILRQKVAESGFATQLVQKIRQRLADPSLPAPPPEAIGPVHDANVIGEYLDSTLPNEQVSEIERACLELDANLAEAAACHQILTMVLGNKADVPPSLRERIYQLPDREIERIAASSDRFSSISMDDTPSQHRIGAAGAASLLSPDELPTIESGDPASLLDAGQRNAQAVQPVGISDSGVFDAPTRLRQSEVINQEDAGFRRPGNAGTGSQSRSAKDSIYGGSIRPSRITPWLVSLAVVGVLLFAVAQIFRPLLPKNRVADHADNDIPTDVLVPPGESPPMVSVDKVGNDAIVSPGDVDLDDRELASSAELLPPPEQVLVEPAQEMMPVPNDVSQEELPGNEFSDMAPAVATLDAPPPASEITVEAKPLEEPEMPTEDAVSVTPPSPAAAGEAKLIATIDGTKSMIMALDAKGVWTRLGETGGVTVDTPVICAPKFRGQMESDFAPRIELIGPAGVRWLAIDDETYGLEVEFGRLLITSKEPGATLSLKLGDCPMELFFEEEETVVAASIKRFRSPGVDPLGAPNQPKLIDQSELIGVLSVQGNVEIRHDGETSEVTTGEQWVKQAADLAAVSPISSIPNWVSPAPSDEKSLDDAAREGLFQLVSADDSLERSLHEATLFRRAEVAALAAQTMLFLGQGDVYFGGDGILNEPKQRQYWPEHYLALVASLDRGPESAELLLQAIRKMDAANAEVLYRLLVGYSQQQLIDGGDEELVRLLDSESMAVRVLALENLHRITGTTLYFRAETDNQVRRTPAIRKWMVRQGKGDIRWPAGSEE